MNVAQIIRLATYQANEVKQAGTLGPFVNAYELLTWARLANHRIEAKLRTLSANYFERTVLSATATAETIQGIAYTPSTALKLGLSSTGDTATLPPDFRELRSIRCVTSGYEGIRFTRVDHSSEEWRALKGANTTASDPGPDIFYDIIGDRTLLYYPLLSSSINIELKYIAKPKGLFQYSTGTVTVSDAATAVTGTTTVWSTGRAWDSAYLDIMWTSGSAVPTAEPSLEYDGVNMSRIASITNDTALVLSVAKVGALSTKPYLIASVPVIPEEYQHMLADYLTARILMKAGDAKGADIYMGAYKEFVGDAVTTAARRDTQEHEVVEDWNPWS